MSASAFPGVLREHQLGDTGLALTAWPWCRCGLTGHMCLAAGLAFSVAGNPGSDVEFLLSTRTSSCFRRARVTVRTAARRRNARALAGIYYIGWRWPWGRDWWTRVSECRVFRS